MSIDRQHSDRRQLRAGLAFVLVLAGTALVGWGGLAAWQAVTENDGSTALTAGVHMQNVATVTGSGNPVTCTDQNSPSACGVIFTAKNITPGYSAPVGTVAITNTGTENSTFQLSLKSALVSGDDGFWTAADNTLCGDLVLTVKDSETSPTTLYSNSLASMPAKAIVDNGGNATWGPGATDTFTFSLGLPLGSPNTDEDSTCTADFTWSQAGV